MSPGRIIPLVLSILGSLPLCAQSSPVPFVGCASDGQAGPQEVPAGKSKILPISPEAAQKLAYYQAGIGTGVLAPRGWYCFATYGSGGEQLYVSPDPIDTANIFKNWKGLAGPAIEMHRSYGGTSGRFTVAEVIARVFPAHRDFVRFVAAGEPEIAKAYSYRPYPADKLTYKSPEIVEFETPPQSEGLGTHSALKKNASPIRGVAMLVAPDTDLLQLSVRLPVALAGLTPAIIHQAERDAAAPP